jgi:predicted TPR repeat methyltransferase
LTLTRDGYDRTAAIYAERFHHHLDDKPIDQAVLSGFAGLVAKGPNRQVIDVGCGTGATTALLADAGVDAWGSTCRQTWLLKRAGSTLAWSSVSDR